MSHPRYEPITRTIAVPSPAVGAEIAITPTGGGLWIIRSLAFTLTTSAAVATRAVALVAANGSDQYFSATGSGTQAASLTRRYGAYSGSTGAISTGVRHGVGFPDDGLWLPQGHVLSTSTDLIDVGDQYDSIIALVDELPSGSGRVLWPLQSTIEKEA